MSPTKPWASQKEKEKEKKNCSEDLIRRSFASVNFCSVPSRQGWIRGYTDCESISSLSCPLQCSDFCVYSWQSCRVKANLKLHLNENPSMAISLKFLIISSCCPCHHPSLCLSTPHTCTNTHTHTTPPPPPPPHTHTHTHDLIRNCDI